MNVTALVLVVLSGLLHALWNLPLKKAQDRLAFVWWYLLIPMLLFSPTAFLRVGGEAASLPLRSLACGVVSGVLQAGNLLAMTRAYQGGDLSVAYPLSRGSAQILIVAMGVGLLGERLSLLGGCGVALMCLGVYGVFLRSLSRAELVRPLVMLRFRSSRAALAAGLTIALYHLTDKVGVQGANRFQYILLLFASDFIAFTVYLCFRHRWELVWAEWRANKASIVVAGCLSLLSYLLLLHALSLERVAYVGPARSVGIVFSVVLGAVFLRERHGAMRALGSALIVAGLVLVSAGG